MPNPTFTEEDRERLENLAASLAVPGIGAVSPVKAGNDSASLTRALAHIEELEARVGLAEEMVVAAHRLGRPLSGGHPILNGIIDAADAYEAATTEASDE